MNQISFQYPAWWLLACIGLGLAYAMILYFRDRRFRERSKYINTALGILRFLAVTTISALLLSPLIKAVTTEEKQPIVIVAQDASASINLGMDSLQQDAYKEKVEAITKQLEASYDVKPYAFGQNLEEGFDWAFDQNSTNLSHVFDQIYNLYSNQNVGAIILATDGIYNEGSNPLYAGSKLPVPVYTLALGDTTPKRDLLIKHIFNNKIAYLGDKFSAQVDVAANNLAGKITQVKLYHIEGGQNRLLQQQNINISSNNYFQNFEWVIDADKGGVQHYRIALNPVDGEVIESNNYKDFFVDVLDARQKILLLAHAPHPDLAALRQSITLNKNYQLDIAYAQDPVKDLKSYDLVIMHQLPSKTYAMNTTMNQLVKYKTPLMFVVGSQTDLQGLNNFQNLVKITRQGSGHNEVQAKLASGFSVFSLSDEFKGMISTFPPLLAPFAEYDIAPNAFPMLYQKVGSVDTKYPILTLGMQDNVRVAVLSAEGIWKWRLFDFLQNQNHDLFNELIGKTIQYLSIKEDKRRFRVLQSKNIYNENEYLFFDAELYNNNYELVNEPDVQIVIKDSEGKEFPFVFDKTTTSYSLNAGILPPGNYSYSARTTYSGERFDYSGKFSIKAIQLELYESTADHALLNALSQQSDGKMIYPNTMDSIPNYLAAESGLKPVVYQSVKNSPAINLKGIFFFVLLLLSAEWFFRRYFGAY